MERHDKVIARMGHVNLYGVVSEADIVVTRKGCGHAIIERDETADIKQDKCHLLFNEHTHLCIDYVRLHHGTLSLPISLH